MAEITNDLLYEVLKDMQSRLAAMDHKLGEVASGQAEMRTHLVAYGHHELRQDNAIEDLRERVARLEQQTGLAK